MKPSAASIGIVAVLLLHGCATLHSAPVGVMWAYFTEGIEEAPDVRAVTYTAESKNCEISRARAESRRRNATIDPACRRIEVGSGNGYWVFTVAPLYSFSGKGIFLGIGVDDRDTCVKVRDFYVRFAREQMAVGVFGECQAVGVKR